MFAEYDAMVRHGLLFNGTPVFAVWRLIGWNLDASSWPFSREENIHRQNFGLSVRNLLPQGAPLDLKRRRSSIQAK